MHVHKNSFYVFYIMYSKGCICFLFHLILFDEWITNKSIYFISLLQG